MDTTDGRTAVSVSRRRLAWTIIRGSAVLIAALASIVAAGWLLKMPRLTSFVANGPTMKLSTATAMLSAVGALLLAGASRQRSGRSHRGTLRLVSLVLTAPVFLFGVGVLVEYATARDFGMGRWQGAAQPSPANALALTFAALALVVWRWPRMLGLFSTMTGGLAAIGWLGLSRLELSIRDPLPSYLFGSQSLPTALGILVLACGIISLRPHEGVMRLLTSRTVAGRMARWLVPFSALLTLVLGELWEWALLRRGVSPELGVALYSTIMVASLVLLALLGAWLVDGSELRRRQAERAQKRQVIAREAAFQRLTESEERLAISERRFRGIFNSTFNFIGLLTPEGVILEANQAALDLVRIRLEDVLGRPFASTPWWAHSEVERGKLQDAIVRASRGETVRFETSHPSADGLVHHVDFTIKPVLDSAGRVIQLVPEGRDITERKQAEDKFRGLLEAAPDAMVVANQRGNIVLVNAQTERLFGYARDQLIGQPVEKLLPERFRTSHVAHRHQFAGQPHSRMMGSGMNLWGLHQDGHEFPVEVSLSPLKTSEGILVSSAIRDITARKAEEARRATLLDVTRTLADAKSMEEAATGILRAVCAHLPWDFGDVWRVDNEAGCLRCVAIWPSGNSQFAEFEAATYAGKFIPGSGLPGTIWQTTAPLWIPDLSKQSDFPRAPAAGRCSLHAAFGVPIILVGQVCGVVEFFSDAVREPDAAMVELLSAIGVQFGHFMERQRAQQAAAAGETLLRQFIKHTPAAIAMLDTQMRYIQASDRWLKDYHLEGRDIIGCSHYEVFPDIPQRWKDIHYRVLAGAVEYCDEDPFPRAGGGLEWLQWEARPWKKAGGEIGGLVFYTQVITSRKQAEAQLRESEARFRGAFENSASGMALVSLEGRWLRVNRAMCELVGRTEAELLACTFQDITHPDDLSTDLNHVRALIAGEDDHYTMEKRYFHKAGHIIWILLGVTLVRDANGKPAYFVSQVSDITPQREAQHRMKTSLDEKEVLLREIHHRVKNNLQVVSSLLQLQSVSLHDARDSAIFQECQERIHAMALVHDRLYRSGNLATIDFAEHLRELATLILRGQAGVTGRVRLNVESEPIEVNLDTAIPLGLIATELITNAYKHAFRGRDSGIITVRLTSPAAGRIQLSVEDNGGGLPEGFQPEKARSLGLRLVHTLGGQLRAKVAVTSSTAGTKIDVSLSV